MISRQGLALDFLTFDFLELATAVGFRTKARLDGDDF